jgi:hypothetical protein
MDRIRSNADLQDPIQEARVVVRLDDGTAPIEV